MKQYDYIIVGSGIAGLYASLLAQKHGSVLILTKSDIDESDTRYAQGGIASPGDSPELHLKDTMAAGAGLCDPEAVSILVKEAPDRIRELINFGIAFDRADGDIALTKEGGHSVPRILHAGGDATGEHIEAKLAQLVRMAGITILEHFTVTEIVVDNGVARGVRTIDRNGVAHEFDGKFIVLCTGGAGNLFKFTTNANIATGDGVALAYRAGAEVKDMEFFQFHPTVFDGVKPYLISEAVRGEGGVLRNSKGYRFMFDYSEEGELATRDVVVLAILSEMKKTGSNHVFLDLTHIPESKIKSRFPNIYGFCLQQGIDITRNMIPVSPAAHYMMGGVKTNLWGETTIQRLFAAGECACTGVHGANRLASNSLLEALVFGRRVVERTLNSESYGCEQEQESFDLEIKEKGAAFSLQTFQSLMWDDVGMVRSGEGLKKAASLLSSWQEKMDIEMSNMLLVGRLMAEAALIREESRGAHFRSDFPEPSSRWKRHIVFRRKNGYVRGY